MNARASSVHVVEILVESYLRLALKKVHYSVKLAMSLNVRIILLSVYRLMYFLLI